jgi:flagellar biogenesis protein FliO
MIVGGIFFLAGLFTFCMAARLWTTPMRKGVSSEGVLVRFVFGAMLMFIGLIVVAASLVDRLL